MHIKFEVCYLQIICITDIFQGFEIEGNKYQERVVTCIASLLLYFRTIKVYNGNTYGIGFFFCLHNKWLILCFQRDMDIFINTDMKKNIVIVN